MLYVHACIYVQKHTQTHKHACLFTLKTHHSLLLLTLCAKVRELKQNLFHEQFDALLLKLPGSQHSHYKDIDEKLKTLRKRLSNDLAKILYCLDDLGPICAYEV